MNHSITCVLCILLLCSCDKKARIKTNLTIDPSLERAKWYMYVFNEAAEKPTCFTHSDTQKLHIPLIACDLKLWSTVKKVDTTIYYFNFLYRKDTSINDCYDFCMPALAVGLTKTNAYPIYHQIRADYKFIHEYAPQLIKSGESNLRIKYLSKKYRFAPWLGREIEKRINENGKVLPH